MSWLGVLACTCALIASGDRARARPAAELRALPAPRTSGGPALSEVLASRRSTREFGARALADAELGQLLWAAQGSLDGHRTAPSAGALYPLTIRVADARGVWRYVPRAHALELVARGDHRAALAAASFGQAAIGHAAAVLVISAEIAITARRYGARAERFATLEAGHAAQNALLEATALGLGAVPIGAFDDAAVRGAAGLGAGETPLYEIAIGAKP